MIKRDNFIQKDKVFVGILGLGLLSGWDITLDMVEGVLTIFSAGSALKVDGEVILPLECTIQESCGLRSAYCKVVAQLGEDILDSKIDTGLNNTLISTKKNL